MEDNRFKYCVTVVIILISLLINVLCDQTFLNNSFQGSQFHNANSYISSIYYGPLTTTLWPSLTSNFQQSTPRPAWNRTVSQIDISSGPSLNTPPRILAPNQQFISDLGSEVNSPQSRVSVNDEDLREFSQYLLDNDVNNAASLVTVNYQGKTTSRSQTDEAPQPLLSVDPSVFNKGIIGELVRLHDNYVPQTNVTENITPQEIQEENEFLDALLNTRIIELTRNFLIDKGIINRSTQEFRNLLKEIWFDMYPRGGRRIGSSGFEHVFIAEIRNRQISGFHNWLFFNSAEKNGDLNYLGYMKKIELENKGAIVKMHFKFHNVDKPVGSIFIGTSPEFEFALYTTCFLIRPDSVCPLRLAGHRFIIRTFTFRYRGKKLIGSSFPEI